MLLIYQESCGLITIGFDNMETVKDHNNVSFSSMLGAKHVWSSFKKKMEEMGK